MKAMIHVLFTTLLVASLASSSVAFDSEQHSSLLMSQVGDIIALHRMAFVANDPSLRQRMLSSTTSSGDLFSSYCSVLETTGQFDCHCSEASFEASCKSQTICEDATGDDNDDVCATFNIITDFGWNFELEMIKICVEYLTPNQGGSTFRDGCVTLLYDGNGDGSGSSVVKGCEVRAMIDAMPISNSIFFSTWC